jgi:hypothetical protein
MLKLIILPLSFFFFSNCFAQYTAADYYDDAKLHQRIHDYREQGKIDSAIFLSATMKARIHPSSKDDVYKLLAKYDSLGFQSPDTAHVMQLRNRLNNIKALPSPPNKVAVEKVLNELIDHDRALVKYSDDNGLNRINTNDSVIKVRREITAQFDSLCNAIGGWPSSYEYEKGGMAVLLLVHNSEVTKDELIKYYNRVANLCLQEKESWDVVIQILSVRKQYFGSSLRRGGNPSDTLFNVLTDLPIEENEAILPYLVFFGSDLSQNGHATLKIITKNREIGEDVKRNILRYKVESILDEELLKYLKDGGFQYPQAVSEDRIIVEVDARADKNVIYKFQ